MNGERSASSDVLQAQQAAIGELGRILLGAQPLNDVLDMVTKLAKETVPAADEVSVTLVKDDKARTAAFTGEVALALDERQYDVGYGPCLDAAVTGRTIRLQVSTEQNYPDFARKAAGAGVGSSLSVGLPVPQGTVGALNIYSHAAAIDEASVAVAQTFAGYAAVAVANAAIHSDAVELAAQMQQAMESRAVIDQAKGILMRDNRCTPDEAFAMLVQASNRSNRKLRDIARAIVEGTQRGA